MADVADVAGIVLAAGEGTRLRPITELRPKALCPVAGTPLVDLAIERARRHASDVAVNAHHGLDAMRRHLERRDVHLSVEAEQALGTAGALGHLRPWIDGRACLVTNADAWSTDDLDRLCTDWDGSTIRLLVTFDPGRPDFDGMWRFAGTSLMPWRDVADLDPSPSGLYEVSWGAARDAGRVQLVPTAAAFVDCGTPGDYLAANLIASGGRSVVGAGAVVAGEIDQTLVWDGAEVAVGERLRRAIRLPDGRTLLPFG